MSKSPYAKLMSDGRYEYGYIEIASDRHKDRLVPVGTVVTYRDAQLAMTKLMATA